jgi:hypothetical protein
MLNENLTKGQTVRIKGVTANVVSVKVEDFATVVKVRFVVSCQCVEYCFHYGTNVQWEIVAI